MKTLWTLGLSIPFFVFFQGAAMAGMAPDFEENTDAVVIEAMESVKNPQARAQSAPAYAVSLTGPNRIAVFDKKIINAIYDNTQLEVQSDNVTGQIFVFPKTESSVALFLTTDDRETYALTLIPQASRSQEIVLNARTNFKKSTASYSQKVFAESVLNAPDFEVKITRLIRALARNEVPEGFHSSNRCGNDCLRSLSTETLSARLLVHKNTSQRPVELQEKYFYQKGVLAVSIVKPFLAHGESTWIYQVFSNAQSASSGESFDE